MPGCLSSLKVNKLRSTKQVDGELLFARLHKSLCLNTRIKVHGEAGDIMSI